MMLGLVPMLRQGESTTGDTCSTPLTTSPALMPGGWSSHGQPVDALHASFRKAVRALDLSSIGCEANLRKRPRSQAAVSQ